MEAVLWLIFMLSAIILVFVILLQEPKGGGLAEAFGGMGAQTFGVKATGITKFTAYVGAVFILSAILLTCHKTGRTVLPPAEVPQGTELPAGTEEMGTPPAESPQPESSTQDE
jgi:preprotein translocase subunit SecG